MATTEAIEKSLNKHKVKGVRCVGEPKEVKLSNRLECNYHLSNKKCLFFNLQQFFQYRQKDLFEHVPVTFHIKGGTYDPVFKQFVKFYGEIDKRIEKEKEEGVRPVSRNMWIVKPGEFSNRGNGIVICKEL